MDLVSDEFIIRPLPKKSGLAFENTIAQCFPLLFRPDFLPKCLIPPGKLFGFYTIVQLDISREVRDSKGVTSRHRSSITSSDDVASSSTCRRSRGSCSERKLNPWVPSGKLKPFVLRAYQKKGKVLSEKAIKKLIFI